jgi:hypothetical protein
VFALLAAAYLAAALVYRTRSTEPTAVPVPA